MNYCPNCGISFTNKNVVLNSSNNDYLQNRSQYESGGSLAVVGIISFLFPIIGIIMFYIYRKTNPQAARTANICTFAGFILGVLIIVVLRIVAATIY